MLMQVRILLGVPSPSLLLFNQKPFAKASSDERFPFIKVCIVCLVEGLSHKHYYFKVMIYFYLLLDARSWE